MTLKIILAVQNQCEWWKMYHMAALKRFQRILDLGCWEPRPLTLSVELVDL